MHTRILEQLQKSMESLNASTNEFDKTLNDLNENLSKFTQETENRFASIERSIVESTDSYARINEELDKLSLDERTIEEMVTRINEQKRNYFEQNR